MEAIEKLYETMRPFLPHLLAGAAVVTTGVMAHKVFYRSRKSGIGNIKAPPNTAVIYQISRGPYAPSISPFPVKLETFCRLAKIPYVVDTTGRFSSRNKIPWMTYNGEVVEDSQMCIEYLKKKVGVDIESHLDSQQKAVAQMIRVMVDEHLYWTIAVFRWVYPDKSFSTFATKYLKLTYLILVVMKRLVGNMAKGQGIGRHSEEEIKEIMMSDLQCLSDYLGNKRFMMGDKMCEADCSAFGMLSQCVFHHFNNVTHNVLEDNFPNLHQYVLRIKEEAWPDWDQCINPPVDV